MTGIDQAMLMNLLSKSIPLKVLPVANVKGKRVGHVIIDAIRGFCVVGCGNLAPKVRDIRIEKAIAYNSAIAKVVLDNNGRVCTIRDVHSADTLEFPYGPHCIKNSGEEILVDELLWLNGRLGVTDIPKHCINGLIGTMRFGGGNDFIEWVIREQIDVIVISGFCTDICVMEYSQVLMSVINVRGIQSLEQVIVIPNACATYDFSAEAAIAAGCPEGAHPADLYHYVGLSLMQKSGITIAQNISFE